MTRRYDIAKKEAVFITLPLLVLFIIKMLNDGIMMQDPTVKTTIIPSEKEAITHAIKNAVKGSLIVLSSDVIPEALDLVKHFKEMELRGEPMEA